MNPAADVEIRFSKFRFASRVHRSKLSPLEDLCPSLDSTTSATPQAVVASARVRSPALQVGPVLILQLHPPSRSRGRNAEGLLVHVLEVLISYHHPRRWLQASQRPFRMQLAQLGALSDGTLIYKYRVY
jgi:hypothetical protein